ncbi:MAG: hypothetical protein JW751_14380 [Polyangiaceae bacterium]|nr:hypothetical protein [Polyangiaceae bacterium]
MSPALVNDSCRKMDLLLARVRRAVELSLQPMQPGDTKLAELGAFQQTLADMDRAVQQLKSVTAPKQGESGKFAQLGLLAGAGGAVVVLLALVVIALIMQILAGTTADRGDATDAARQAWGTLSRAGLRAQILMARAAAVAGVTVRDFRGRLERLNLQGRRVPNPCRPHFDAVMEIIGELAQLSYAPRCRRNLDRVVELASDLEFWLYNLFDCMKNQRVLGAYESIVGQNGQLRITLGTLFQVIELVIRRP